MSRLPIRARYGWGKTILLFAASGGIVGALTDELFPHDHSAASTAFGVALALLIAATRPFEPRSPVRG